MVAEILLLTFGYTWPVLLFLVMILIFDREDATR